MRFISSKVASWAQVVGSAASTGQFLFRVQANSNWKLSSTLERALYYYNQGYPPLTEINERRILEEFKTKFHLYATNEPDYDDHFEWLAHLQHHGCPTRLVDFTSSIYIAAFFALTNAVGTDAAIWCISRPHLITQLKDADKVKYREEASQPHETNQDNITYLNSCIGRYNRKNVVPHVISLVQPRSSMRLARQNGLFLAQTTFGEYGRIKFEHCLNASFGGELKELELNDVDFDVVEQIGPFESDIAVLKLILPAEIQLEARAQLIMMGITDETMFPDLDGLARSLIVKHLRFHG